jgi:hypothetical protein
MECLLVTHAFRGLGRGDDARPRMFCAADSRGSTRRLVLSGALWAGEAGSQGVAARRHVSGPAIAWAVPMNAHLPSLAALESNDDVRLAAEVRLAQLRSQAAIVHALADQVEHLSRAGDAEGLGDQMIEEMARLGCLLLETADSMASAITRRRDSGIFARVFGTDRGLAAQMRSRSELAR